MSEPSRADGLPLPTPRKGASGPQAAPYGYAFERQETRHTRLKRPCDCGCVIDGGEPYVYEVWKLNAEPTLEQRRTCEPCAVNYAGSGGWYRAS